MLRMFLAKILPGIERRYISIYIEDNSYSNQTWCFLSGLPRHFFAVLYTTLCRAAHSSSGVEFSFSSHWARAQSIYCSELSLWLMVLSYAALSLLGLLVPCLLCFCRVTEATFDISIWRSGQ